MPTSILDLVQCWDLQEDWGPKYGVRTFETKAGVVGAAYETVDHIFLYELHTLRPAHIQTDPTRWFKLNLFLSQLQARYPQIILWKIKDRKVWGQLRTLGFTNASVRALDGTWAGGMVWTRGNPG